MNHFKKNFTVGNRQATIEYGEIGRQANATVIVNMEDTVVMSALTANREHKSEATFLPLTVDYQEKYYAAGRIPGSFFRREGRPTEKEILVSRLIDRSIRPLFPDFFYHEMQILPTVLSYNPEVDGDIPAMLATYAALHLSGVPFNGPVSAARVGHINGIAVVNPTQSELAESKLDLIVAGSENGVLMVESEARELPEEEMLKAIMTGHREMQTFITAVKELGEQVGRPVWEWQQPTLSAEKQEKMKSLTGDKFAEAYQIKEKQERETRLAEIRQEVKNELLDEESDTLEKNMLGSALKKIESGIVRERILSGQPRIDGRGTRTVRPISIRTGVLPRTHGSALFTRGETQALVVATLGSDRDNQKIDSLNGEQFDGFMFHYNMPPYATGETGRSMGPKRREIGHGRLAKRGLLAAMPTAEQFSFTLRLVSEITESNGSSSMASVCGGSLALMDAGVPVSAHVSGIAMGLITDGERFSVLSDILGDEDHLGDMDFKVAGTRGGITALQMDLKISGINEQIMQAALQQAHEGRQHILEKMEEVLAQPRKEASQYAPRMLRLKIPVDKIRDIIGKGGSVIKNLQETTSTRIDVEDNGIVTICGKNSASCESAKSKIEGLTSDLEMGRIYEGKVENILENVGAVISVLPGRDGLLHISQISDQRINKVSDHLQTGQIVRVKVLKNDSGRVRFSMRKLDEPEAPPNS